MVAQPNNRLHGKQRAIYIFNMGVAQSALKFDHAPVARISINRTIS